MFRGLFIVVFVIISSIFFSINIFYFDSWTLDEQSTISLGIAIETVTNWVRNANSNEKENFKNVIIAAKCIFFFPGALQLGSSDLSIVSMGEGSIPEEGPRGAWSRIRHVHEKDQRVRHTGWRAMKQRPTVVSLLFRAEGSPKYTLYTEAAAAWGASYLGYGSAGSAGILQIENRIHHVFRVVQKKNFNEL